MDFSNIVKQVEQFIYELLMWVIFYPYTLVRVIFRPTPMMTYVRGEVDADPDRAFASAIRPPVFLFLSIAIGSMVAPIGIEQAQTLAQTELGTWLTASWVNLLVFRTLGYSVFALTGALLYDWLTPGTITRDTLRSPFYQQCYICGPFALAYSPTLVRLASAAEVLIFVAIALQLWLLFAQTLFFRRLVGTGRFKSFLLALVVLIVGNATLVAATVFGDVVMN